jgi:hypothetical protein
MGTFTSIATKLTATFWGCSTPQSYLPTDKPVSYGVPEANPRVSECHALPVPQLDTLLSKF